MYKQILLLLAIVGGNYASCRGGWFELFLCKPLPVIGQGDFLNAEGVRLNAEIKELKQECKKKNRPFWFDIVRPQKKVADFKGTFPAELMRMINQVKQGKSSNNPLLVYGESGVGKTLAAEIIAGESDAVLVHIDAQTTDWTEFEKSQNFLVRLILEAKDFLKKHPSQKIIFFFDLIETMEIHNFPRRQGYANLLHILFEQNKSIFFMASAESPYVGMTKVESIFADKIELKRQDEAGNRLILDSYLNEINFPKALAEEEYADLIKKLKGYSGQDLQEVANLALSVALTEGQGSILKEHVEAARAMVEESSKSGRETLHKATVARFRKMIEQELPAV